MLYGNIYAGYRGIVEPLNGIINPDGTAKISKPTMMRYWPNWVRKMNESDKEFCCCHHCHFSGHVHKSIKLARRKLLKTKHDVRVNATRSLMKDNHEVKAYEAQFFPKSNNGEYCYKDLYDAALTITCNPIVCWGLNDEKRYIKQQCAEGVCQYCPEYVQPVIEATSDLLVYYYAYEDHQYCCLHPFLTLKKMITLNCFVLNV